MSCQGEKNTHTYVRSICFHSTGVVFIRDSDDRTYLLGSAAEASAILDGKSSTEDAISFLNEFPSCSRCIPIALRRRKAIKSAMKMVSLGIVPDADRA
jgi:hypothetical protein